jgi:putative cell wall-binding protein
MSRWRSLVAGLAAGALVALGPSPVGAALAVDRIAGPDRYATAVAVAASAVPGVGGTVVVVNGDDPADALAAGPVAARLGPAPVLLVRRDSVPSATATELARRAPTDVVVLGGPAAVSDAVVASLGAGGARVRRLAGADRFATAAAASAATFPATPPVAYVANGLAFADALAGSAAAALAGGPLLLVRADGVPAASADELMRLRPGRLLVLGGDAVVPTAVLIELSRLVGVPVTRLAGPDRYTTAAAVSAESFPAGAASAFVASGVTASDALAGAAAAAARRAPLLLTEPSCLPDATASELARLGATSLVVLGGEAAVSAAAASGTPCRAASGVLGLTEVGRFEQPIEVLAGPSGAVVVERVGRLRRLADRQVVLDVAARTTAAGERGLLGAAFSRDGTFVYVHYTDLAGDTTLDEYRLRADGTADPATRRLVLAVDQPYSNHNGGQLAFGPDGRLYLGLGDGGGAGDPDDRAQDLGSLLGKILRIDPRPSGAQPYGIPPDNPFVGRAGARPEVWAYGLRNPWRFSFDPDTGDLWVGDVGQGAREEIDLGRPVAPLRGADLGWPRFEGTLAYRGGAAGVAPVYDYPHSGGRCSVTGGHVVRTPALPWLVGAYVFGDFCAGNLQALRVGADGSVGVSDLGVRVPRLSGFGVDGNGRLYAASLDGPLYRLDRA